MQGQTTSATCSIAQKRQKSAVLADPICTKDMRAAFLEEEILISKLQEIDG